MTIACDMDGIVTGFVEGFSKLCHKIDPRCPVLTGNDTPNWEWREWYAPEIPRNEIDEIIEEAWDRIKNNNDPYRRGFWFYLKPLFPDQMEYLAQVAEEEPIIFVTRRDAYDPWDDTTSWLRRHGIEKPLVYVVKSGEEKGDVCAKLGVDIIIEDSPKYAPEILDKGHSLVMIQWKYNEDYVNKNKNTPGLYVVDDLASALIRARAISARSNK